MRPGGPATWWSRCRPPRGSGSAAYSALVVFADGSIGCLYERGEKSPYETIAFARFGLEWLTGGEDSPPARRAASGKKPVRVGAAQPRSRLIDFSLREPSLVLARVERSLGELEELVHRAGAAGCDALALPEDTLGLGHWEAANPAALKDVLPVAVARMIERLGRAASAHRIYL